MRPLVSLMLALPFFFAVAAQAAQPATTQIGPKDRQAIVDKIAGMLDDSYVFPEIARKMGERLRQQLKSGAYDKFGELPAFADQITQDLREVSHDLHLGVMAVDRSWAKEPSHEELQAQLAHMRRENFCFREMKLLPGNVGYLKLDCFAPTEFAGPTASAALGFLAGSDAVIIDLRESGGGSPHMSQLLASYLLPAKPTQLSSLYVRKGDRTEQLWTQEWVPGPRLSEAPVYVLTSPDTFSAAEGFAYDLKALKRATIVGEATGGGAHSARVLDVEGYPLGISVPYGRAVNPVTGTNWEGTGVAPDVAVPAAQALTMAHSKALAAIAAKTTDAEVKATATLVHQILEGRLHPVIVPAGELAAMVGTYGPRRVTLEGGVLLYQRDDQPRQLLLPIGNDQFLAGDFNDRLMRFERGSNGKIVRMIGVAVGREELRAERSAE
ncbi:MAG TPA: S41 family peptidase [Thermoanaerobaculia bacterium]|nr:S41 family peptidase [Thermoanaerobaculia bacterium]